MHTVPARVCSLATFFFLARAHAAVFSPSELYTDPEVDLGPLPVVENLDWSRLFGRYYEIGTYLQWIEKGCSNSVVTFGPRDEPNTAAVSLECDRGFFHPRVSGEAVPIDPQVPARTIATFHPPIGGDYSDEFDVVLAASNHAWVVIGHPKRSLLWILNRDPAMNTSTLDAILTELEEKFGYDDVRGKLSCTRHRGVPESLCTDALPSESWFDRWLSLSAGATPSPVRGDRR